MEEGGYKSGGDITEDIKSDWAAVQSFTFYTACPSGNDLSGKYVDCSIRVYQSLRQSH